MLEGSPKKLAICKGPGAPTEHLEWRNSYPCLEELTFKGNVSISLLPRSRLGCDLWRVDACSLSSNAGGRGWCRGSCCLAACSCPFHRICVRRTTPTAPLALDEGFGPCFPAACICVQWGEGPPWALLCQVRGRTVATPGEQREEAQLLAPMY